MLDLPRVRPPLYRRPWFLATFTVGCILLMAGGLWAVVEKSRWEQKARAFDYSRLTEMESASIIYDRSGGVLGRIFIQNRDQVSYDEISPHLITAVIAGEDARFYAHTGWDWYGITRAMVNNLKSKKTKQGASTLTQQLRPQYLSYPTSAERPQPGTQGDGNLRSPGRSRPG
jgi:penicillin-binding protein 1A